MPKHPFICAIVSDNSAAEQIELCQHSISSPVRIITTESSKCIVATRRVIEEGAAVIVSRGSVWSTIKKAFPLIPTLQTPITCCDAIEFLTKAKQYDTNIGVVSFPSHIAKMVTVAPHLGVSLTVHQVNNPDDIEKGCYEMRDKGMKVLVGGGHAVQWAQKLGLHGVLHTVSADGVIQVLNEADRILNAIISERSKDARVRTMLNALKDGAISLNEQGKILEYNLPAQKMFANGESTMKSIRTFLQDTGIIEAVQQQLTWSGESKKYEKKQYLCNIIPAYSNDIYCGASVIIQDASHIQSLEHKMRRELHAKGHVARYTLKDVVGHSAEMRSLVEHAELYANSPSSIFIYGESGTGKEIFAQGIHMASPFRNGPFVGINCTALPESLLESELFGYAEGAFTGAKKGGKVGLFEMAHNGTLFLDEIGEIPTSVQAKLLRVLEEKIVMRIGQERYIPINVRIISILNEHPLRAVDQGLLRRDLFYRLAVVGIAVPPLRKRQNDIPLLVRHIINRSELAMKTAGVTLDDEVMGIFRRYPWPGNIRELAHVIEGSLALLDGSDVITVHNLPRHFREACNLQPADDDLRPPLPVMRHAEAQLQAPAGTTPDYFDYRGIRRGDSVSIKTCLHEYESSCIRNVLRVTGGNVAKAARIMELTPAGLHYRMKVLHIENED